MNTPKAYDRSTYNFDVPETAIAQAPLAQRDASQLLVRSKDGSISHHRFADLPSLLPSGTLLILNESRVIPARLFGRKDSGAEIEVFLLEPRTDITAANVWSCLGRPLKKLNAGSRINFPGGLTATVVGERTIMTDQVSPLDLRFSLEDDAFKAWLHTYAKMPLPPYIKRSKQRDDLDRDDQVRYQTVYGAQAGSVAAPTAGLHFTPEVFAALEARGIELSKVCLHVGAGTFLPVKTNDIRQHQMHEERFLVPRATFLQWQNAKKEGRPVIAVGTTSLRVVEGFARLANADQNQMLELCDKVLRTDIFIHPREDGHPYPSWLCNGLMTNFHQPESSLFMLVCALLGTSEVKTVYADALRHNYRFFSYGDSSLLWL